MKWDLNPHAWADPMFWLFASVEVVLCVCACGWGEYIGYVTHHQDWIRDLVSLRAHLTQDINLNTESKWSRILIS